jgi:hypothetical protein
MADFNREACKARNRLAARRDCVSAVPWSLFRTGELPSEQERDFAAGGLASLPKTEADVLAAINRRCMSGQTLSAEQVWWRYAEAANDTFISDRFLFLDKSTLKNIARDAEAGFAFMNSHRTGGMSHPTEQPFGWTFGGAYTEAGGRKRTMVGVYMLRGIKPNGDSGPSTDDLAAMIDAGTAPDVSVGLRGGEEVCDVCGETLMIADPFTGETVCGHYPGTSYGMNKAQIQAQMTRGVTKGLASSSLVNAGCGEISSVYDGAVPGAGFRKALSLCRRADVSDLVRAEVRQAYGPLLRDHDFSTGEPSPRAGQTFADQSESVLAAVDDWLTRAESVSALREGEGRRLSSERLAELQGFIDRAQALVTANSRPDLSARLRALRLSQLAQQAGITV